MTPAAPNQLFFTTGDCTGEPRLNPSDAPSIGYGAYHFAITQSGTLKVFALTGVKEATTQMGSMLQGGSCSSHTFSYSFYTTVEVTGLPAPPSTIAAGYRVSAS